MGKKTVAIAMACILAVTLMGCSKKKADDSAATASSTTTTESKSDSSTGNSDSTTGNSDSSGGATDLNDAMSAAGMSGDCLAVASAVASVHLGALGMDDATQQAFDDQLNQLKGKIPSDIQDALDTIAKGIKDADGLKGISEFFDSQEYKDADQKITDYLDKSCNFDG